jgi:hypothetical protein
VCFDVSMPAFDELSNQLLTFTRNCAILKVAPKQRSNEERFGVCADPAPLAKVSVEVRAWVTG